MAQEGDLPKALVRCHSTAYGAFTRSSLELQESTQMPAITESDSEEEEVCVISSVHQTSQHPGLRRSSELKYCDEHVNDFLQQYSAAVSHYDQRQHPDPGGKLQGMAEGFIQGEVQRFVERKLQHEERDMAAIIATGVVEHYRQEYNHVMLFEQNLKNLGTLIGHGAMQAIDSASHGHYEEVRRSHSTPTPSEHSLVHSPAVMPRTQRMHSAPVPPQPDRLQITKSSSYTSVRCASPQRGAPPPDLNPDGLMTLTIDQLYSVDGKYGEVSCHYDAGEHIGSGGFGKVQMVTRKTDNKAFVMKSAETRIGAPKEDVVREVWTMAKTDHPNLVKAHDFIIGEHEEDKKRPFFYIAYIVMDAVTPPLHWDIRHPSLTEHIVPDATFRFSEQMAALVIAQVHDCHNRGT
jgi:hypothetical protein